MVANRIRNLPLNIWPKTDGISRISKETICEFEGPIIPLFIGDGGSVI